MNTSSNVNHRKLRCDSFDEFSDPLITWNQMIEHRFYFMIFSEAAVFEFVFAEYFGIRPLKIFSHFNNLLKQKNIIMLIEIVFLDFFQHFSKSKGLKKLNNHV